VDNICADTNNWKIFLNYINNTIDITLINGGRIANETFSKSVNSILNYGPYWSIRSNGVFITKYVGSKKKMRL
jgi:hypothetical protein